MVSPIVAFGEFWGIHYIQHVYDLKRPDAALLNSAIFLGIAIGGPTIGLLARHFKNYVTLMRICVLIALFCLCGVLFFGVFSYQFIMLLLFTYGLMSSNMLLCFSLINTCYDNTHQATAIGFANTIIMFGAAFFPVVVGFILDYITRHHPYQFGAIHTMDDLKKALVILPISLLFAFILTFFIKTKGQQE